MAFAIFSISKTDMAALLDIHDLRVSFDSIDGRVHVLRGVDLRIARGERVAVVGESGSGKSVTARAIMGLLNPRRTDVRGRVEFEGTDLLRESAGQMRARRGREITMVFQDPTAALNPVFPIREQFRTVVQRGQPNLTPHASEEVMLRALRDVAIAEPERVLDSYSFQLSGGLNQRVMIAMSLVNTPKLLIADEPGTALDVTVQQQTLELMRRLSASTGAAILFISHNLGVVRHFADRVYVMYAGTIVEAAPVRRLFAEPQHPYTRSLLASVPRLSTRDLPVPIDGMVPDLRRLDAGCPFRPRCGLATGACREPPAWVGIAEDHGVACIRADRGRI
jgi:oligopeptide/dipeptide ABC transporter ATP-binding protein